MSELLELLKELRLHLTQIQLYPQLNIFVGDPPVKPRNF